MKEPLPHDFARRQEEQRRSHDRRKQLQEIAARALLGKDKAIATRDILKVAARLVEGLNNPSRLMMVDLKAVIIGEGFTDFTGRGRGPYYVGEHPLLQGANSGRHRGSEGFLPWYSDEGFQVHHIFAALLLGGIPLGETYAKFAEKADLHKRLSGEVEWWDIYVYEDFCPIGRAVNDHNYKGLGDRVYSKLTGIVQRKKAEQKQKKPQGRTVRVESGDWLSKIAGRLWGDEYGWSVAVHFWPVLWDANKSVIGSNPNKLRAGMILQVPELGKLGPAEIQQLKQRSKNWRSYS